MEPQAEEPPATAAAPAAGLDLGLEMEEPKEEAVVSPRPAPSIHYAASFHLLP